MFIARQVFLPFYIIFLLLAICERLQNTFFKKKLKPTQTIYFQWILKVLFSSYIAIVLLSIIEYFMITNELNLKVSGLGFIVFICGALLRRTAICTLGDNWSNFSEIKKDHTLVTKGIYKFLQHPYYIAVILELMGVCFISNSYFALILIFLVQTPFLLLRIKLEDGMLEQYFGNTFTQYKKRKF